MDEAPLMVFWVLYTVLLITYAHKFTHMYLYLIFGFLDSLTPPHVSSQPWHWKKKTHTAMRGVDSTGDFFHTGFIGSHYRYGFSV